MIDLPPIGPHGAEMWEALLDIAVAVSGGWTLVGGQMVLLHALEHGQQAPRVSQDLDLVVDVRVRPAILPVVVKVLEGLGFAPDISANEVANRFTRERVSVDVLSPDGAGIRADLGTAGRAATVSIPRGTFALSRSHPVDVASGGREARIPRPDLAGAILLKAGQGRGRLPGSRPGSRAPPHRPRLPPVSGRRPGPDVPGPREQEPTTSGGGRGASRSGPRGLETSFRP